MRGGGLYNDRNPAFIWRESNFHKELLVKEFGADAENSTDAGNSTKNSTGAGAKRAADLSALNPFQRQLLHAADGSENTPDANGGKGVDVSDLVGDGTVPWLSLRVPELWKKGGLHDQVSTRGKNVTTQWLRGAAYNHMEIISTPGALEMLAGLLEDYGNKRIGPSLSELEEVDVGVAGPDYYVGDAPKRNDVQSVGVNLNDSEQVEVEVQVVV